MKSLDEKSRTDNLAKFFPFSVLLPEETCFASVGSNRTRTKQKTAPGTRRCYIWSCLLLKANETSNERSNEETYSEQGNKMQVAGRARMNQPRSVTPTKKQGPCVQRVLLIKSIRETLNERTNEET